MKTFLPPVLLLAAMLLFSAANCSYMSRETDRWSAQLEQADRLAADGDWSEAADALDGSYQDWSSRQTYLHIVVKHEEVDGAEAMYRRADAFAKTQELTEFRAEIADLRDQLRLLSEMEQFSIKNVL